MNPYIVFDNGGRTADRFTIINRETGDVFGSSEKPDEPGGISKYCGNCASHRIVMYGAGWRQKIPSRKIVKEEVDNYVNNARLDQSWIGMEIDLDALPVNLCKYMLRLKTPICAGGTPDAGVVYMATASDKQAADSAGR